VKCHDNPYVPAFADLIASETSETIQRIRMYYASLKRQARSVLSLQQTLVKGYNCVLNDDCLNIVGSYLSGHRGTLATQIATLRTVLA
jgi:hypothetical protein